MSKVSNKAFRDVKSAPARTQIYIACLTSKHGATAQDLKDAVIAEGIERRAEGFTSHNSYSLQKLADTYGFRFFVDADYEGAKRYFFASAKNDPKLAKQAKAAKLAKQAAKAARKVPAETPAPALIAKARKANSSAKA